MSQRLVRAKTKIRDAGTPFRGRTPPKLGERLAPVLDAVYAAYGAGWDETAPPPSGAAATSDLSGEAVWLARMVVAMLPGEPEALGLLSLALHCEARRDAAGECVPLALQDPVDWDSGLLDEADMLLRAGRLAAFGRYQREALAN